MKAAILKEYLKPLVIEEAPRPTVRPDEVLVKVKACGICGTDLKICAGNKEWVKLPLIPGHEIAGEIVELGSQVRDLRAGDRGVAHFFLTCGKCAFCREDREVLCDDPVGKLGFSANGGLAEYVVAPGVNFIPIPDSVPFTSAAIVCDAIATPYRALQKAAIKPGEYVLVMGLGGLGIHGAQIARTMGANVIGVDIDPAKLELAKQLGIERVVRPDENGGFMEGVLKQADGNRISAILETVSTPASVAADLKLLGKAGKLILAGYTDAALNFAPLPLILQEQSIYGSIASSRRDVAAVISLIEKGAVKPVVNKTFPLDEVNCAMSELKAGRCIGRQVVVM